MWVYKWSFNPCRESGRRWTDWFKIKNKKEKKTLADFSSERGLEQAEEISGLLGVELRILIRAEAGRVELRGVSDPNDVVEEAEEEETDEWRQVEV